MLLPNKGMPAAEALERVEEVSASRELPVEDLQRLRLRQQRNTQIFERQKSRVQAQPIPLLFAHLHDPYPAALCQGDVYDSSLLAQWPVMTVFNAEWHCG